MSKPTKVQAGVYTLGPFEISYEPDMEIAAIEGDRKFWQIMVLPGSTGITEGAYGRFETLREAVEEINTQRRYWLSDEEAGLKEDRELV